jgi:hypothetical protein
VTSARLSISADLALEIDGQPATLRGQGQTLRLTIEKPRTLKHFFEISLPEVNVLGKTRFRPKDFPRLLTGQGLTLEIADTQGPLLLMGKGAEGKRYTLPIIGRVEDVALVSLRAAARLAWNY